MLRDYEYNEITSSAIVNSSARLVLVLAYDHMYVRVEIKSIEYLNT